MMRLDLSKRRPSEYMAHIQSLTDFMIREKICEQLLLIDCLILSAC